MAVLCRNTLEEIAHLGKWNDSHMTLSYLDMLPFPAVSVAAGHMKNTYMLPRGRVVVPKELTDLIFPPADGWLLFSREVRLFEFKGST